MSPGKMYAAYVETCIQRQCNLSKWKMSPKSTYWFEYCRYERLALKLEHRIGGKLSGLL